MLNQHTALQVKSGSSWHKICPFPVGYIYLSYTNSSPATNYGGSWTAITGRFLYCNKGTGTGGANTHVLKDTELPEHRHRMGLDHDAAYGVSAGSAYSVHYNDWGISTDGAQTWMLTSGTYQFSGGGNVGQSHNNMPAYQTCYAWRRTA